MGLTINPTTGKFDVIKDKAKEIKIPKLSGATYKTQEDFNNSFGSCGRKSGGEITDATGGYIAVAAGTGFIKATDDDNAQLLSFNFPAPANIQIPASSTRYIGVEYNSGTPRVVARTSWNWNKDSEFSLGRVINEVINGVDTLHIISNPWWVTDGITNVIERLRAEGRIFRDANEGGLMLSVTGTRNIAVTAGTLWSNLNEFDISAIDTSVSGTIEYYWYSSTGAWQDSDATAYSATQYNDPTQAALVSLDNNKYYNTWVYAEADDKEIALIYGQAQYNTQAAAAAVEAPSLLPQHIQQNGILVGRIIAKQGVTAPILVQSAFTTSLGTSTATNHNALAGLQGGQAGEYYHGTAAQISNWNTAYNWGNHATAGYLTSPDHLSSFRVFRDDVQTIQSDTWEILQYNTTNWDIVSSFDISNAYHWMVKEEEEGLHDIKARVKFKTPPATEDYGNSYLGIRFMLNGNVWSYGGFKAVGDHTAAPFRDDVMEVMHTDKIQVEKEDEVWVEVFQSNDQSAVWETIPGTEETYFSQHMYHNKLQ